MMRSIFIIAFIPFLLLANQLGSSEEMVALKPKDIPTSISKIVLNEFPNYKIDDAIMERIDNKKVYSISMVHLKNDDNFAEITIDEHLKISQKGMTILSKEIPKSVKLSLNKKYPAAKILSSSKLILFENHQKHETYNLDVHLECKAVYLTFTKNGKLESIIHEDDFESPDDI